MLAGDVFYEQPMARHVLEFLDEAAGVGVEVLVGDPGREYLPRRRVTPLATYDVPGTADSRGPCGDADDGAPAGLSSAGTGERSRWW